MHPYFKYQNSTRTQNASSTCKNDALRPKNKKVIAYYGAVQYLKPSASSPHVPLIGNNPPIQRNVCEKDTERRCPLLEQSRVHRAFLIVILNTTEFN
jgi:hypothetical protein